MGDKTPYEECSAKADVTTAQTLSAKGLKEPQTWRLRWPDVAAAIAFVALIGLDRLTLLAPIHMTPIAPWNPLLGVCVAVALFYPVRGVALAFAGAAVSEALAPQSSTPLTVAVLEGLIMAVETAAIVVIAHRIAQTTTHALLKHRLLCALLATPAVSLLSGALYVASLAGLGTIPIADAADHLIRFWVGSVVGVVIFAPLVAIRLVPGPKEPLSAARVLEAIAQVALVVAAVWMAFGVYPQTASRYLFVVFLPMIWIVLRFGMRGAIAMNALVQISMIASLIIANHLDVNATLFQALLLVLASSGLIFGLAVDQSKAATLQLRAREEELSISLRMAATGELAGTLAHELGHPLGAISNYASALNHVIRKVAPDSTEAVSIGAKLTQEIIRATDTLHRMREFFKTGALTFARTDLGVIAKDAALLLKDKLARSGISPYIVVQGGPNIILGDEIQLRAVVYNLLVNAIDALKPVAPDARVLSVSVRRTHEWVTLQVEDSGAGVATDVRDDIFEPLVTTKEDGLGLGLSMSRSVIHAHGGIIVLEDSALGGAKFIVSLPAEN